MHNIIKTTLFSLAFALVSTALFSCGGEATDNTKSTTQDSIAPTDTSRTAQVKTFFYSLPSPLAMAAVFKSSGLPYLEGMCNNPDNVGKYTSNRSQCLNMGIYNTDLAYNLINNQTQNSLKYLECVKKLSDGVGLSSVFETDNYLSRFKSNMSKNDSLAMIFSDLKRELDLFIYDNKKQDIALFIFTGAWVESMYIATQTTKNKTNNTVALTVADQKYVLDKLLDLLSDYNNEPNFKDLFLDMNNVKKEFEKLATQGEDENAKVQINEHQLKVVTEKLSELRTKLVSQ
jgi:hypothetical protein